MFCSHRLPPTFLISTADNKMTLNECRDNLQVEQKTKMGQRLFCSPWLDCMFSFFSRQTTPLAAPSTPHPPAPASTTPLPTALSTPPGFLPQLATGDFLSDRKREQCVGQAGCWVWRHWSTAGRVSLLGEVLVSAISFIGPPPHNAHRCHKSAVFNLLSKISSSKSTW